MKFAFVHCWIFPGGALQTLKNLITEELEKKKFDPEKDSIKLFTLVSEYDFLQVGNEKIPIVTALPKKINNLFLYFTKNKVRVLSALFDYRNLMVFYPRLMNILSHKIRKFWPKKIIISSFAIAKNIEFCKVGSHFVKEDERPHIELYLHSPMQYIWSHHNEYIEKLEGWRLSLFEIVTPILRKRDVQYTRFDELYANSEYTSWLAKKLYNLETIVRYPHIEEAFFHQEINDETFDYYVYVGRLVKFVRETDKIIKLFNQLKKPLIVMGNGPDELALKAMANDNIIFVGWIDDLQERIDIIKKAKGLINLTKESFGIGTAEALLLGVPVFGYNDGATPELVDKISGVLVDSKDQQSLLNGIKAFEKKKRNRGLISKHIKKKILSHHQEE